MTSRLTLCTARVFHPVSHTMFIFILRHHGGGRMCTCTSAFVHALPVTELPSVAKTTDPGGVNVPLFYVLSFFHLVLCISCMAPSWFHPTFPTRLYFLVLSLKSKNLSLVLERDGLMVKITYALVEDLSLVLSTYTRWLMTPCNPNSWKIWCPLWLLSGTCTHMHIPTQRNIT